MMLTVVVIIIMPVILCTVTNLMLLTGCPTFPSIHIVGMYKNTLGILCFHFGENRFFFIFRLQFSWVAIFEKFGSILMPSSFVGIAIVPCRVFMHRIASLHRVELIQSERGVEAEAFQNVVKAKEHP